MTLEVLLVMVVFVIPLLVGMFLLGRKLFTLYLNQRTFLEQPYSRAVVWDSSVPAKVIGPVVGYDPYEAPLVIFRDDGTKSGVVLGVRRDRFTSFAQMFYTDDQCRATPRVRSWSSGLATGISGGSYVGALLGYPPAGFMYQMQSRSYAMGPGNRLYKSTQTPGVDVTSTAVNPLYVWKSQDMTPPEVLAPVAPCFLVPDGTTVQNLVDVDDVVVIDFDRAGNYVKPFLVAFPTPGPLPALPPPSGGG